MIKVDNTRNITNLPIELLKRIFNGYYKLGARLPSTRELAKQASVNPIQCKEPYKYCKMKKILIKQSTTGRYVTIDIQYLIRYGMTYWNK